MPYVDILHHLYPNPRPQPTGHSAQRTAYNPLTLSFTQLEAQLLPKRQR